MYINIIFMAVFMGYSLGSAPIVSYHYGAKNNSELKNLFKKSITILSLTAIILVVLSEFFGRPLIGIFTKYDVELFEMTSKGFRLYALSFLFMGFNVWGSSFFTALNNGIISAAISFLRTFVFQIVIVLTLPLIWGLNGIWLSIVIAELFALGVTTSFLIIKKKTYNYM